MRRHRRHGSERTLYAVLGLGIGLLLLCCAGAVGLVAESLVR